MVDDLLSTVSKMVDGVDWRDERETLRSAARLFDFLTEDGSARLLLLVRSLPGRRELRPLCERLDFMDKLVLWAPEDKPLRLRLHIFRQDYADSPHDHRFPFAARIVAGEYIHRLYGERSVLDAPGESFTKPLVSRVERPGDQYVMSSAAVHSVSALQPTASLVLRGPIEREASTIVDRATGARSVLVSTDQEPAAVRAAKVMSDTLVDHVIAGVSGLIGC